MKKRNKQSAESAGSRRSTFGRPAARRFVTGSPAATRPALRVSRRSWPLALVISIDILLVGIGLVIFALFHHVLPRDVGMTGQSLPQQAVSVSGTVPESTASILASIPLTGPSDSSQSSALISTTAVTSQATTSKTGTGSSTTAANAAATGQFSAKFKNQFTNGMVEKTATSYKSAHVNVSLKKVKTGNVTYLVSDIYVSDIRYFRTAFASGKYGRGLTDTVFSMATTNKAITAISGDYYGIRDQGIVIRNGILYRKAPYQDVLIMNNDGSMQTFSAAGFNMETVLKQGAWQGWSFGPMLLTDGKPMTSFNSDVTSQNPRGAIGYFEPGHYCFILVDGRQPGYSDGMTMKQLSQLAYDLGCKVAYNLDGGQSAVLTFQDAVANSPYNGGRKISDIVFIADT